MGGSSDGPWSQLTPTSGEYEFEVTDEAGRYGVAMLCYGTNPNTWEYLDANVLHATTVELHDFTFSCDHLIPRDGHAKIEGELRDFEGHERPRVYAADRSRGFLEDAFTLEGLYPGRYDAILNEDRDYKPDPWVIFQRDIDVFSTQEVNFDYNDRVNLDGTNTLTIPAGEGFTSTAEGTFTSKNGTHFSLPHASIMDKGNGLVEVTFSTVPEASLVEGDRHELLVGTTDFARGIAIGTFVRFAGAAPESITLPTDDFTVEETSIVEGAYPRQRYEIGGDRADMITFRADHRRASGPHTIWRADVSAGWLQENRYTMPDLSDLPGWEADWNYDLQQVSSRTVRVEAYFITDENPFDSIFNWESKTEGELRRVMIFNL